MKTDRELLELAAKAAGLQVDEHSLSAVWREYRKVALLNSQGGHTLWNPLTDDGDEARLEAALGLNVWWLPGQVSVFTRGDRGCSEPFSDHNGDKQAARCRAGVRAAAAIGEAMPDMAPTDEYHGSRQ